MYSVILHVSCYKFLSFHTVAQCTEILIAKMLVLVFWVVISCGLKITRWKQYVPLKHWYLPTSPHDVTTYATIYCFRK
jgi:hypothetical protein